MTAKSGGHINIKILFFGALREAAGADELTFKASAPFTVDNLRAQVFKTYPPIGAFGRSLFVAVNREYAAPDVLIAAGDEVAFFPPVSGG